MYCSYILYIWHCVAFCNCNGCIRHRYRLHLGWTSRPAPLPVLNGPQPTCRVETMWRSVLNGVCCMSRVHLVKIESSIFAIVVVAGINGGLSRRGRRPFRWGRGQLPRILFTREVLIQMGHSIRDVLYLDACRGQAWSACRQEAGTRSLHRQRVSQSGWES